MACTSGSVQRIADKSTEANIQIQKLQSEIQSQQEANKSLFYKEISAHLSDAGITDARELTYSAEIKTEYTSEFSLDKIAAVVTSALKAVVAAQDPTAKTPAISPEAIAAYTDVVNTVAEAAKSTSSASATLSFSMNRLSPGLFAFLYASSVSIKDEDTFGTEAVTTTAIYYRMMQSIDDIRSQTTFGEAIIDARNLLNMKILQAALTDDLADGRIDLDEWSKKDSAYSAAIEKIQIRLNNDKLHDLQFVASVKSESSFDRTIVVSSLNKLKSMGTQYAYVIEVTENRISSNYY